MRVTKSCDLDEDGAQTTVIWNKMDTTRGFEWRMETRGLFSRNKCKVLRELAVPEVLPMPFVTENSRISLIIPVSEEDISATISRVCHKIFLLISFVAEI